MIGQSTKREAQKLEPWLSHVGKGSILSSRDNANFRFGRTNQSDNLFFFFGYIGLQYSSVFAFSLLLIAICHKQTESTCMERVSSAQKLHSTSKEQLHHTLNVDEWADEGYDSNSPAPDEKTKSFDNEKRKWDRDIPIMRSAESM